MIEALGFDFDSKTKGNRRRGGGNVEIAAFAISKGWWEWWEACCWLSTIPQPVISTASDSTHPHRNEPTYPQILLQIQKILLCDLSRLLTVAK